MIASKSHILRQSQHFRFAIANGKRVLEVGGQPPVQRPHRPVVRIALRPPVAGVDHRLDSDDHPLFEDGPGLRVADNVVRHLRVLVHLAADAVTDVLADDGEALTFDVRLDGSADLPQPRPRPGGAEAAVQRLPRHFNEPQRLRRYVSHARGQRRIGNEPLVDAAQVYADDVAVGDLAIARDAVDDLIVHGHAHGGGVSLVAQEDRYHLALLELPTDDLVQLLLYQAGPKPLYDDLQHLRDDAAGIAHDGDLVPRLEDDGHAGYRTS